MLPSQERSYLRDLFVERFLANLSLFDLKPRFSIGEALKEFRGISSDETVEASFAEAELKFERRYPLGWSNEKSCAFRTIDGEKVYSSRCR